MQTADASGPRTRRRPYRPFREDPKYDEIKKLIEDFPPEKMDKLRSYIQRWLRHP